MSSEYYFLGFSPARSLWVGWVPGLKAVSTPLGHPSFLAPSLWVLFSLKVVMTPPITNVGYTLSLVISQYPSHTFVKLFPNYTV